MEAAVMRILILAGVLALNSHPRARMVDETALVRMTFPTESFPVADLLVPGKERESGDNLVLFLSERVSCASWGYDRGNIRFNERTKTVIVSHRHRGVLAQVEDQIIGLRRAKIGDP
jgi:hypothetical protein